MNGITWTRFVLPDGQKLGFAHYAGDWRFVHYDPSMKKSAGWDGFCYATVGPIYKTKAELLADLPAYAERFGF